MYMLIDIGLILNKGKRSNFFFQKKEKVRNQIHDIFSSELEPPADYVK